MSIKIIQDRLNDYQCFSELEEEQAIREITQEIVLAGLSRTDFSKIAAFHGGTCLRIFYGLNRFSEDLDFMLKKSQTNFTLEPFLKNLTLELKAYGYEFEIIDRSNINTNVKKAFLKDSSLGKILMFNHIGKNGYARKIKIKIEVDQNPPQGSHFESKFFDFPFIFSTTLQDLPSLFAGKIHALLSREYTKGRDWYDFLWYTGRNILINFEFLSSALNQIGPWENKNITTDLNWCISNLKEKIMSINWEEIKNDMLPFVKKNEIKSIELWEQNLFLDQLERYSLNRL